MTLLPRRQSIRARLALIYTGLLAAAEHASGAFAQDIDADGVLQASERLIEQLASTGGRVIVLDPSGAVLADSADRQQKSFRLSNQSVGQAGAQAPRDQGDGDRDRQADHRARSRLRSIVFTLLDSAPGTAGPDKRMSHEDLSGAGRAEVGAGPLALGQP